MSDVVTALLLALADENADLREQLASAQDMLMETAIDAGNLHALVEALRTERDAWRDQAEWSRVRKSGQAGTATGRYTTATAPALPTHVPEAFATPHGPEWASTRRQVSPGPVP